MAVPPTSCRYPTYWLVVKTSSHMRRAYNSSLREAHTWLLNIHRQEKISGVWLCVRRGMVHDGPRVKPAPLENLLSGLVRRDIHINPVALEWEGFRKLYTGLFQRPGEVTPSARGRRCVSLEELGENNRMSLA